MEDISLLAAGQERDHALLSDSNMVEGILKAQGQKTMAVREHDFDRQAGLIGTVPACLNILKALRLEFPDLFDITRKPMKLG